MTTKKINETIDRLSGFPPGKNYNIVVVGLQLGRALNKRKKERFRKVRMRKVIRKENPDNGGER